MPETPFNSQGDPRNSDDSEQKPPKPEQIWPPPAPKLPKEPEEKPVDLTWADEVEKIDEAIAEIRQINGASDLDDELDISPLADVVEEPASRITAEPRRAPAPHGPTASVSCRVRPQSENEIAQLWSNIFFSTDHPAPKAVVVTTARRGDGATQIATALALVGADSNDEQRVCLVDFNVRNPAIASAIGLKGAKGLTDVLNGTVKLDEAIHTVTFKNGRKLYVLPAGAKADQPLSLIKSRQVKAVLSQLRDRFDQTIIDAASANVYPDAQTIGVMTDGALLVVRAGDTPRETVADAKKRLDLGGVRCLGLVMNQRSDPIPALLYQMT